MNVKKTTIHLTREAGTLLTLFMKVRGVQSRSQALGEVIALATKSTSDDDLASDSLRFAAQIVKSGSRRVLRGTNPNRYVTLRRGKDDLTWALIDSLSESRSHVASRMIVTQLRPPTKWDRVTGQAAHLVAQ